MPGPRGMRDPPSFLRRCQTFDSWPLGSLFCTLGVGGGRQNQRPGITHLRRRATPPLRAPRLQRHSGRVKVPIPPQTDPNPDPEGRRSGGEASFCWGFSHRDNGLQIRYTAKAPDLTLEEAPDTRSAPEIGNRLPPVWIAHILLLGG